MTITIHLKGCIKMKIALDLREANDIKEAHKKIKEELNFPDYYGANLDALNDCISELDGIDFIYILVCENTFDGIDEIIGVFEDNGINCEKIVVKKDL